METLASIYKEYKTYGKKNETFKQWQDRRSDEKISKLLDILLEGKEVKNYE